MLVQALFYQASLRYYDNQICDKTDKLLKEDDIKAIGEQRKEFVRFTNQYWFHNVTTQMQGSDIFTLQQKALGLKQHYAILKDELERTDEYLQTRHEIKIASITDKFTTYGLIFAVLALYTSLLPFGFDLFKTELKSLWVLIGGCGVACSPLQVICGKLIALLISVVPAIGMIVLAKRVRNNH